MTFGALRASRLAASLAAIVIGTGVAIAGPKVGAPAPDFSGVDTAGKTVSLKQLKGKTVVLEWTNDGCPYVKKHYNSGNMQSLQQDAAGKGAVWLTIISSAPGEQGHLPPAELDKLTRERGAAPSAVLIDADGTIGKAYNARVTPHMYVIDPAGTLRYMGAIDDKPTADKADVAGARNYVKDALDALAAGRDIDKTVTRAYGCSVKYKSS